MSHSLHSAQQLFNLSSRFVGTKRSLERKKAKAAKAANLLYDKLDENRKVGLAPIPI